MWTSAVGIAFPLARYRRISRRQRFVTARIESDLDLVRLIEAIETLPLETQQVVILRKVHDWHPGRIAMHLRLSDNEVERHLRDAVIALYRALFDPNARNSGKPVPQLSTHIK
jgi:DNA-directed RNA polymerase specialized sigma24 family protein